MSRSEESDEEVYLSDPSDDEESKSVDDYEFANDQKGAAEFEASSAPTPAKEIDTALHDAEAERAAIRDEVPQATTDFLRTVLSPDAPPFIPPGHSQKSDAAAPSGHVDKLGSFAPETFRRTPIDSAPDSSTAAPKPSGVAKDAPKPPQDAAPKPSKSQEQEAVKPSEEKKEAKPADDSAPKPSESLQEKESKLQTVSGPFGIDKSRSGAIPDDSARDDSAPADSSSSADNSAPANVTVLGDPATPKAAVKGEDTEAPGSPIDVRGMFEKAAASQNKTPAADSNGNTSDGKEEAPTAILTKELAKDNPPPTEAIEGVPEMSDDLQPLADSSAASAPKDEGKETEGEPSTTELSAPEHKNDSESSKVAQESESEPSKIASTSDLEPLKAEASEAGSSEGQQPEEKPAEQKRSAGSAMPSLPDRKRPGSAMPSLPARPARRPAAAPPAPVTKEDPEPSDQKQLPEASGSEAEESSDDGEQPSTAETSLGGEAARPTPANGQNQTSANGQGGTLTQPPANGQRGPVILQRLNQPQEPRAGTEEDEKVKHLREELRELRILLLRIGSRLNLANHAMIEHVKYRLGLAERIRLGRGESSEDAQRAAQEREEANSDEDLADVTVLVMGTSGSGKTSTINSLLGREAFPVNPFEGTKKIAEASGTAFGLKLRFIDTPGLQTASESFSHNSRVLKQINNARKKYKPKLVMYCDRLDMLRRDLSDVPVLRQITETLGSEVWYNTILILTHARSPGPLGPNNQPLPFDALTQTRAAMLTRAIQAAVGDSRIAAPAGFAENSPSCPCNDKGEPTLPNGQVWRRFVLMWILSMRILSDADTLLEVAPRENAAATSQAQILQQLFQAQRAQKMPPLQYLVPNMIRHAGPKTYPDIEREVKGEDEIRTIKDFDQRRLEYRKRTEYLKSKHLERLALALPATKDELEGDPRESPAPGPPLAPTFDADDHSHLYRAFEPRQGDSAWLTRARLDQNCFDHTDGVDSLTTERSFVFRTKGQDLGGVPSQVHAIIQKDKNTTLVQADTEASYYQRYNLIHTGRAQFLTLSAGDILYVSQLESQLTLPAAHRMTIGAMAARLGEDGAPPFKGHAALGLKLEEDVDLPEIPAFNGKHGLKAGIARARVKLGNRNESATGWNAEYQLTGGKRENVQVVASVSEMEYRGNKGRQYSLSAAVPVSDETVLSPKVQLRDGQGNFYLRVTSHDHPSLGLFVLVPLGKALWDKLRNKEAV